MWQTKIFKTSEAKEKWLAKNGHKIQYHEIAVNNAYGVEYKKLRRVY